MVRRGASLDANQTWRQPLKERQDLATLQLTANNHLPGGINAMNLKDRLGAIVKDQPLTIDASCDRSMFFVWEEVFQDNDLHIVLGNASLQQRSIFEDRVVLTVTAIG